MVARRATHRSAVFLAFPRGAWERENLNEEISVNDEIKMLRAMWQDVSPYKKAKGNKPPERKNKIFIYLSQ